jgi:cell division protease FtsH
MRGEPPHKDDDDDDGAVEEKPSLTAIPKTKPKAKPGDGGMEPEPSA